ncbi:MAG: DUF4255 domain-containing protein [Cyclobacteriaceae bacterium]|nr:DUF4255 domain-containing protein [Cyclobacteriaceae bacterium]
MIYQALHTVTTELNNYLMGRFKMGGQQAAILNAIVNQDGTVAEHSLNKIVLSLINLEHETTMAFNPIYFQNSEKTHTQKAENLPYNFNLDVLLTAVFEAPNYDEGLKFLSEAIYFFQAKNAFTVANTPQLDPHIQELSFELIKLSYHQEHSLWGAIGAKYMPSVLFKIRMLSFQSTDLMEVPQIARIAPARDRNSIADLNPLTKK